MGLLGISKLLPQTFRTMSTITSEALVPVDVRGMKNLDRARFTRDVTVPILKVSEEKLSKAIQICKAYFLKFENFKPIQNYDTNHTTKNETAYKKCIHLTPEKVKSWTDISEEDRNLLHEINVTSENYDLRTFQLNYDNWKYEQIFKAVLPEGEEVVSGFSQIGHIIHLNLREHLLDYRPLIGQVLIDKIKTCRTVVNKCNTIDNTYRNFSMEVIAGDDDFLVTVKENRCNFQFDFSKVYWNPRLGKEHERILSYLKPDDVLFDVFCGVGPFSVPAAKRNTRVFANDLNPDSFKWLNHNAKSNKVNMKYFNSYNLDGKDFILTIFKKYLENYCNGIEILDNGSIIFVTMNLPAMAVEFLKHFSGLIKDRSLYDKLNCSITIYVYCFAIGEDADTVVKVAKDMVNENFGCDMSKYIRDVFDVRNVSPKKEMMRVTIDLTREVLLGDFVNSDEPPVKKVCLESDSCKE